MVTLTLTNTNPRSQELRAQIDLKTGLCTLTTQTLDIISLFNQSEFTHPLLDEPWSSPHDHVFHYRYKTIDELLYSGVYVYTQLLHAKNPRACRFNIAPAPEYELLECDDVIDFSAKASPEIIAMRQFERLVEQFMGSAFSFSEDLLINDFFSFDDLPSEVDMDALYELNENLHALLKNPRSARHYEIRYIDPIMALGVFTKVPLVKGDIVGFYTGVKRTNLPPKTDYAFYGKKDCLSMNLDARLLGNITRFINHAPKECDENQDHSILTANIYPSTYYLRGLHFIVYEACKDIPKGAQLLVDYGQDYFIERPMTLFLKDGSLVYPNKNRPKHYFQKKVDHLLIMAQHGIKSAQVDWYKRALLYVLAIGILILFLNHA